MTERLTGKKILVTRPVEQAGKLCELIEKEGGITIRLPVIDIKPLPDEPHLREILSSVSSYDIGIFISQNAVRWTLELLNKDMHALYNLKIVAIGKATASILKQAGITEVEYAETLASSETLLELPVFADQRLKGAKIIIFRGAGGREFLADRLSEKGAFVDYVDVYQRIPCRYDSSILDNIFFYENPDFIVVTSNEGLQNLFDMLSSKQRDVMLNTQLLVLGKRMADLALKLGFTKKPVVAEETSDRGLLKAIMYSVGTPD